MSTDQLVTPTPVSEAAAPARSPEAHSHSLLDALRGQPRTVWVTAFAAVIAFMGIGLVDPILNSIAEALNAPHTKLTQLFGVYMGVQVIAMLLTGVAAYRFGPKRTLTAGLVFIVLAAGISAFAGNIDQLIALRVLWGLGNALFIATALAFIVGQAKGGQQGAILLYEAALGVGLAVGPLLGALLGEWSWRAPFAGTALLMLAGATLCAIMLPSDGPRNERQPVRLLDPIRALKNRTLLINSIGSAFYTGAFFTVIAWSPIAMGLRPISAGMVFFGWGVLTAVSGVFLAPKVARMVGDRGGVQAAILAYAAVMAFAALGVASGHTWMVMVAVIVSGIPSGVLNTLFTGVAMSATGPETPRSVASAGYSFLRWLGAAASAMLVAYLAQWFGASAPFWFAAAYCAVAVIALVAAHSRVSRKVPTDAALVGAEEF